MKNPLKIITLVFISALLIPLSACAGQYEKASPRENVKYSIDFLKDGNVVVRDVNGNIAKPIPLNLPREPLPVKAIQNFHTIIEAQGSCLVLWGNVYYNVC